MESELEFWYARGYLNPEKDNPFRKEWEDYYNAFFTGQCNAFVEQLVGIVENNIASIPIDALDSQTEH